MLLDPCVRKMKQRLAMLSSNCRRVVFAVLFIFACYKVRLVLVQLIHLLLFASLPIVMFSSDWLWSRLLPLLNGVFKCCELYYSHVAVFSFSASESLCLLWQLLSTLYTCLHVVLLCGSDITLHFKKSQFCFEFDFDTMSTTMSTM